MQTLSTRLAAARQVGLKLVLRQNAHTGLASARGRELQILRQQDQPTRIAAARQAGDDLLVDLLEGRPIIEDFVGSYEPPAIPDIEYDRKGRPFTYDGLMMGTVPRPCRKRELALKAKWGPRLLLNYNTREAIKCTYDPGDDLPWKLRDWITAVLDTAWSHWCRAILQTRMKDPFHVWIQDYLIEEAWFEFLSLGTLWDEAAQALRLSLGLPRFRFPEPT